MFDAFTMTLLVGVGVFNFLLVTATGKHARAFWRLVARKGRTSHPRRRR
jgi:hypothetical protein